MAVSVNLLLFGLTAPFAAALFLPVLAALTEHRGWRSASCTVALTALAVVPFVLLLLRERPSDIGLLPYGAAEPRTGSSAPTSFPPLTITVCR